MRRRGLRQQKTPQQTPTYLELGFLERAHHAVSGHPRGVRVGAPVEDDSDESVEDESGRSEDDGRPRRVARRVTGTCAHCGAVDAIKRCSRCQGAWFCGRACQAAAWPAHSVSCFARSETEAWWGKLGGSTAVGRPDLAGVLQQRLEFRRAVAATRERRQAAAAAAAQAAAARAREGQAKGGKGGKDQGDKEETCAVCQCEFTVTGDSGDGICCPSSHFLCSECTGVFVQSVMNDLEASYPPKCSMCRAEIPIQGFERQLSRQQQHMLAEFVTQRSLAASETMLKCSCGYMEVRTDMPVLWWCPVCSRGECQVCNQLLPSTDRGLSALSTDTSDGGLKLDLLLRPHIVGCASLRGAKQKVDKAMEAGQKMPCPGCGLAGMKDEACTHMNCPRCQTSWCYLCGLSAHDCDKKPPRPGQRPDDIFLHNADWEVNSKRCPMYLTQILEVDPAWLGADFEEGDEVTDDRCLAYFHRWRTIKLLQEVRDDVGADTFEQVWLHFASVRRAGYELEDIVHTDTTMLIDRDAYGDDSEEDDLLGVDGYDSEHEDGDEPESEYAESE
ncbi:unnamed protein product [Prorocentrum cordatum]|uniref:RBR-type E3 ubiquitin transferase n=1 Tax=Prorocentrum cordatum TaxID=2364126 RepID=A0ABN9SZV0_9DINO|nr:unnamed protein product [Polarella glacialis]